MPVSFKVSFGSGFGRNPHPKRRAFNVKQQSRGGYHYPRAFLGDDAGLIAVRGELLAHFDFEDCSDFAE